MTRAEEQRRINDLYARGEIDREEWSRRFDELSSTKWRAQGLAPTLATKWPEETEPQKENL